MNKVLCNGVFVYLLIRRGGFHIRPHLTHKSNHFYKQGATQ
jgi:hypothetical protein